MDEGNQIQQEREVPEVPLPGHSARDDGKTKKSWGPPECNSSKNNKDGYRRRSQSPTLLQKTTLPPPVRENISESARRERKGRHSSPYSPATRITSDSDSSGNEPTIKRFKMVPEDRWYKYKISRSKAFFVNEHFELYLSEKELHSNIFKENPVPDNVEQVKKLDDFAISVLKDRRGSDRNELINKDTVLDKIQLKMIDVIGHLSRLWDIVKKATVSNKQSVTALLDDMRNFIVKIALMVGQISNTITYHRRYNLLYNLMLSWNKSKKPWGRIKIYSESMMEICSKKSSEITLW